MVLLHHEVEVEFPDDHITEKHRATLLEFGRTENGKTTSAMALTVGIPAGIGALVCHISLSEVMIQAKALTKSYVMSVVAALTRKQDQDKRRLKAYCT